MSTSSHSGGLLERMRGGELLKAAGAHNGLTAVLAARSGFDAVWAGGLEISASHAIPDADILGVGGTVSSLDSIISACNLPVIVDCDAGYGSAMNALFMAKRYFGLGAAALCLEDKRFPKINSFALAEQTLEDVATFCGKLRAVCSVRTSADQFVIARTEALIAGSNVSDALRRAEQYEKAGADAILVHDKTQGGERILDFASRWAGSVPLVVVPTTFYDISAADLHDAGFALVIYANQGMRAQVRAVQETYERILADGRSSRLENEIATVQELFDIQGLPAFQVASADFVL
jgi:phosphoenolpyruvate phosphomutase